MLSYIINFKKTFQLPYNKGLLRLICESSSSKKVKPFFRAEIGASEKSAGISKIWDKNFFCQVPKANEILGNAIKFQVNTISILRIMTCLSYLIRSSQAR